MTLQDLYVAQNPIGLRMSTESRWRGGPNDPSRWQMTDDDLALNLSMDNSNALRAIGMKARADEERRKANLLKAFTNRPVNLYQAPRTPQEAELQQLITQDQAARQIGLNNAPKWDEFRRTQMLKDVAAGEAIDQAAYNKLARRGSLEDRQLRRDDLAAQQEYEIGKLDLQEQTLQQKERKDYLNTALEAIVSGVPKTAIASLFPRLNMQERALLSQYADAVQREKADKEKLRQQTEVRRLTGGIDADPKTLAAEYTSELAKIREEQVKRKQLEDAMKAELSGINRPWWLGGEGETAIRKRYQDQINALRKVDPEQYIAQRYKADPIASTFIRRSGDEFVPIMDFPTATNAPALRTGTPSSMRIASNGIPIVSSIEEARMLPPGTQFYNPNGQLMRVPGIARSSGVGSAGAIDPFAARNSMLYGQ